MNESKNTFDIYLYFLQKKINFIVTRGKIKIKEVKEIIQSHPVTVCKT